MPRNIELIQPTRLLQVWSYRPPDRVIIGEARCVGHIVIAAMGKATITEP